MINFGSDVSVKGNALTDLMNQLLPVGSIIAYPNVNPPEGWLRCDGTYFTQTDYPELWEVLDNSNFEVDSTTKKTPDLNQAVIGGYYNQSGSQFSTFGARIGELTHTLTVDEMPSHSHPVYYPNGAGQESALANMGWPQNSNEKRTWYAVEFNVDYTGGGAAHNNVQLTVVLNYIIKAKPFQF